VFIFKFDNSLDDFPVTFDIFLCQYFDVMILDIYCHVVNVINKAYDFAVILQSKNVNIYNVNEILRPNMAHKLMCCHIRIVD